MKKPETITNDEYDFFDEMDECASPPKIRHSDVLRQEALDALQSDDVALIKTYMDRIGDAWNKTRMQIKLYKEAPSQRRPQQNEAWLARAIGAEHYLDQIFKTLDRRRRFLWSKIAKEKEEKAKNQDEMTVNAKILSDYRKEVRMSEGQRALIEHDMIKAKAKVAALYLELRRCRHRDRKFISLLASRKLLSRDDIKSLWEEVDSGYESCSMKRAREDLDRWNEKLKQSKNLMRTTNSSGFKVGRIQPLR